MPRIDKALIEFKGTTLPVVSVSLRSLHVDALDAAASALFGDDRFFDGEPALLDFSQLADEHDADWPQLKQLFATHGLSIIGVRGGPDELRQSAESAGLPCFAPIERAPRANAAPAEPAASAENAPPATPPTQRAIDVAPPTPAPTPAPAPAPSSEAQPTRVIDRPLRSGQRVYARGGDLVVLAAVNAGAEVIADGSIHIYAPLRGRALAGASGAAGARIFTTRFEAELVSIAGVYRTFDAGVPGDLAGKPAQVQLVETPAGKDAAPTSTLTIAPLKTD